MTAWIKGRLERPFVPFGVEIGKGISYEHIIGSGAGYGPGVLRGTDNVVEHHRIASGIGQKGIYIAVYFISSYISSCSIIKAFGVYRSIIHDLILIR